MARFKSLDVNKEKELERYKAFAEEIRPLVIETVSFLHQNLKDGKHILVEGANAAMLDIDFGELKLIASGNIEWIFSCHELEFNFHL